MLIKKLKRERIELPTFCSGGRRATNCANAPVNILTPPNASSSHQPTHLLIMMSELHIAS